ncbi:hypothetical protein D3C77_714600 [compost metagenome]
MARTAPATARKEVATNRSTTMHAAERKLAAKIKLSNTRVLTEPLLLMSSINCHSVQPAIAAAASAPKHLSTPVAMPSAKIRPNMVSDAAPLLFNTWLMFSDC